MRHARFTPSLFALIGALTAAAHAQTQSPAPQLVPVEQTIEDVNALGTSLRQLRPDLRIPLDFARVYRVPGSSRGINAFGPAQFESDSKFQRIQGGLTAVFDESQYMQDKKGRTIPVVPAGTVYFIGGIPQDSRVARPIHFSPFANLTQVVTSVDTTVLRDVSGSQRVPSSQEELASELRRQALDAELRRQFRSDTKPRLPRSNVLTDETFRKKRVRELLCAADTAGS